ncbi:uncharacterized protein LOC108907156 [Anoplophora glabripennis]|uniref:uncharacterized protein LOC108907156 n=1 Tax=Anoplophora glabripennis TaxID=217634 RepID=UPI000874D0B3|nr:uncharacterized protein LOC108907156 [Anoplophora glabripennis]
MTQPFEETPPRTYFEDVLPRTGWGLYYKFMLAMACVACFSQATAFFALPFSIALSTCEYSISRNMILNLDTSFVLGRAFGGFLLSSLCDIYGRKRLMTHTMLLIFISCFIAAFALETNYCVVRVHLTEILPLNRRGFYLAICDLFWSFGYLFVSLLGIFLKDPLMTETSAVDMKLAYWKMMFAIAGGLNLTVACATALLEESPRYFLHIKKYYLALLTLKQFYAINKSSFGEYLEVKEADVAHITDRKYPSIYPEPHGCDDSQMATKYETSYSWREF